MRAQFSTIFFVKLDSKQKSLIFFEGFVLSKDGNHFAVNFLFFFQHKSRDTTLEIITLKAIRSKIRKKIRSLYLKHCKIKSFTCKDGEFPEFYTFRSIGRTNFPILRRKFDETSPGILIQHKNIFFWFWPCFGLCPSK